MRRSGFRGLALQCSVLAAVVLGAASAAFAQTAPMTDGQLLQYVQSVNEAEIADAQLALRRAKSSEVKIFAKHMEQDHSASEKAIAGLVRKGKIKLAKSAVTLELENKARAGDKELQAAEGTDFDKQYAQAQAEMHSEVAAAIQSRLIPAAASTTSEGVKSTLSQTLSTIQEHQRMAQDLAGRI